MNKVKCNTPQIMKHTMLNAKTDMIRHQGAIFREFITTKGLQSNTYFRCQSPLTFAIRIKN